MLSRKIDKMIMKILYKIHQNLMRSNKSFWILDTIPQILWMTLNQINNLAKNSHKIYRMRLKISTLIYWNKSIISIAIKFRIRLLVINLQFKKIMIPMKFNILLHLIKMSWTYNRLFKILNFNNSKVILLKK